MAPLSMFFLLSLVSALPPLPHGSRLALTAPGWGRGVGTGGAVWPAAEVLARWLLDERKTVQGARVLELGSGTGAVGLFAAGCGASSVLLTDGDASLCSLAADNARDNAALMPDATVTTTRYRWGGSVEALGGPFDLALASDLTYEPAAHGAPVVYELVAAAPHGVCTATEAAPSCAESGRCPFPAWAACKPAAVSPAPHMTAAPHLRPADAHDRPAPRGALTAAGAARAHAPAAHVGPQGLGLHGPLVRRCGEAWRERARAACQAPRVCARIADRDDAWRVHGGRHARSG